MPFEKNALTVQIADPFSPSRSGLGEAISTSFAKEGANVAVNYFNRIEPAQNVVQACEKHGVKAVAIKGVCAPTLTF